jgi:hypothetical protein
MHRELELSAEVAKRTFKRLEQYSPPAVLSLFFRNVRSDRAEPGACRIEEVGQG